MNAETFCSHSGPRVIGSRIPLSSRIGIITTFTTGAMTFSSLVAMASALEAAAQAPPTSRVITTPSTTPSRGARMPIT